MKDRKPNRMQGYDYSTNNLYFITTCVHDRVCCFGEIIGTGRDPSLPQMILNEYGIIAEKQWNWLENQYPYVKLHAFVVMPNHIHGIIEIDRDDDVGTGRNGVRTGRDLSLQKIKSLSELIGAYKTTVSKQIHLSGYMEFAWQRSFYDNIIRDGNSYETISHYIMNNPVNWNLDKFYKI